MSKRDAKAWILSGFDARALATEPLGRLLPQIATQVAVQSFDLLDQFPIPLLRSGCVLLRTGEDFTLIAPDGHILFDHGPATGRFIQDLPAGPIKDSLASLSPLRSLVPIGSGKASRLSLAWLDELGKTQCRATVILLSGDAPDEIAIVTLLGLRGYEEPLTDLTARLASSGTPLAGSNLLHRLFPATAQRIDRDDFQFAPTQTAFAVARCLMTAHLEQARRLEAGVIADLDTEFLHDYRVALRKVRSVVSLFRDVFDPAIAANLKTRFSALMEPTGLLRDLDVQIIERQQYYNVLPPSLHPGLDCKFDLLAKQRRKARDRLSRELRSDTHTAKIEALIALCVGDGKLTPGPMADAPALAYGSTLIWNQYRKVGKRARALSGEADDLAWHNLRITCKKLRYLMEFFAPLFPAKDFRLLLRQLKNLQDSLGVINDCAVQQARLADLVSAGVADMAAADRLALAQTAGALTVLLHQQQKKERHRARKSLDILAAPEARHAFRTLLKLDATG